VLQIFTSGAPLRCARKQRTHSPRDAVNHTRLRRRRSRRARRARPEAKSCLGLLHQGGRVRVPGLVQPQRRLGLLHQSRRIGVPGLVQPQRRLGLVHHGGRVRVRDRWRRGRPIHFRVVPHLGPHCSSSSSNGVLDAPQHPLSRLVRAGEALIVSHALQGNVSVRKSWGFGVRGQVGGEIR
jgi:hypothetical protein